MNVEFNRMDDQIVEEKGIIVFDSLVVTTEHEIFIKSKTR